MSPAFPDSEHPLDTPFIGTTGPVSRDQDQLKPSHSNPLEASVFPQSPSLSTHEIDFQAHVQLIGSRPNEGTVFMSHSNGNPETQVVGDALAAHHLSPGVHFVPPSPVLSIHDIDFPTSLQLRDNQPHDDSVSGYLEPESKVSDDHLAAHHLELAQEELFDPTPFRFRPHQLVDLLDPKDFLGLVRLGGIDGIIHGLGTHAERGLTTETEPSHQGSGGVLRKQGTHHTGLPYSGTIGDRKRVYGVNTLPTRQSKTLLGLITMAILDKMLILLCIAAVVSLILSFFQDSGQHSNSNSHASRANWVESVAIIVAIAIFVVINSLNDWRKERQFVSIQQRTKERSVKVIRDGSKKVIDIQEVVVGDIALIEPGEIIPCDGIFLSGHDVTCDEAGSTGDSEAITKVSYPKFQELARKDTLESHPHTDCFMLSGAKVLDGVGKYVVITVGRRTFNGRIMLALRGSHSGKTSVLQVKLNKLSELIGRIGIVVGLTFFVALFIRFFVQFSRERDLRTPIGWGIAFVNVLTIVFTLIVVAVVGGLPLAATFALAFATKRMIYEKLLVRVLGSCETLANLSTICVDKTGILTQNDMTVVAGSVGVHAKFVRILDGNPLRTDAGEMETSMAESNIKRRHYRDFSMDQAHLNDILSPELRNLFNEAIAINSMAFENIDLKSGTHVFVGSKTEVALLQFAKELGWKNFKEIRSAASVVQMIPFSSHRKAMGVVIELPQRGGYRAYFKGASEILAKRSARYILVHRDGNYSGDVETVEIDDLSRENISRTIISYSNQSLRTIALCYRDFDSWPPTEASLDEAGVVPFDRLCQDLTLIAITGIEDPLGEGVRDAVSRCYQAGVTVKMCTGDNVLTARSVASQCGIFTPGGIIIEGPVFRQLSQSEMIEVVPRLQVLARSTPEDKRVLVETLKMIGETVGVTGDGANDDAALRKADVGFSMAVAGTETAKEASDIVVLNDSFVSVGESIIWGRCVIDSVRKLLQFQITTSLAAVCITFVSAVSSFEREPALSVVQLLWVNIIMDGLAVLALTSEPASENQFNRKPDRRTGPLVTLAMCKMILLQSVYQILAILVFHFQGLKILKLGDTGHHRILIRTLVFNAFVFAQIFNSVNCSRLDSNLDVFKGLLKNKYFIVITLVEIVVQVLIVFVGGAAFQVTRLGGREWGISLALGFLSIPWGALIRLLPDKPFEIFFKFIHLVPEPEVLPTVKSDYEPWGGAASMVRDNLHIFANIRGRRVRSSSFVLKNRQAQMSADDQRRIPMLLTMVPSLIIGSVGNPKYVQPDSQSDPANNDPSRSSAALWEGKLQIHPDTATDDPIYQRFGGRGNTA